MPAIDVTDETFETEVLDRSKAVPVVIDLWAEWCGPCKTLGPILEKVVAATNGKVVLAKVDIESNPALHQAFKVQSIPAVYAMKDGAVVEHSEAVNRGAADRPLSNAEIVAKFHDNAALWAGPGRVTAMEASLLALDDTPCAADAFAPFCGA